MADAKGNANRQVQCWIPPILWWHTCEFHSTYNTTIIAIYLNCKHKQVKEEITITSWKQNKMKELVLY